MGKKNKNKPMAKSNDELDVKKFNLISKNMDDFKKNENITQEDLADIPTSISSEKLQVRNIESKFEEVVKLKGLMEKKASELEKKINLLQEKENKIEETEENLEKTNQDLNTSIQKYDEKLEEINTLRLGNFTNIINKEIIDKYAESLNVQKEILINEVDQLKIEQVKYLKLISIKEQEIIESQSSLTSKRVALEEEFENKFFDKETELENAKREINKLQRSFKYEVEDFEEEKEYLQEKAKEKVANELLDLNKKIEMLEEKNINFSDEVEELKDLERHFGGRDPKRVIDELNEANDKIYQLQDDLEVSPDSVRDAIDAKKLRQEKIDWKAELDEAYANVSEYKQKWEKEQLSIGEKETLEFQKEELVKRIELQQIALDEFQEILNKSDAAEVFVSCIEMDEKYQSKENIYHDSNDLSEQWIKIVQQKLACRDVPLFYDENVLRSFVSGLAMSRFNILQGISGTGKTSLPESFSEAIGGHFETIEVQSGWKDRQDLIGYYNTFEKKFYESDFLKALYKANTPQYRNKPFFIILDEMNLSHPEHYFADILSLMEKTSFDKQKLKICDKVGENKPEHMIDEEGFKLQIPDNVWFIGTANHDETTLQFAPKTYDRANVMEMPKSHTEITIDRSIDLDFIFSDNQNLLENFKIEMDHNNIFNEYLSNDGEFKKLCNKLGIGWGNRLDKQLRKFIPVFTLLGGSDADAMDHIISSKILRNIQGRYDLQEATLNEMREELEENFTNIFKILPIKCLEIITQELEKK